MMQLENLMYCIGVEVSNYIYGPVNAKKDSCNLIKNIKSYRDRTLMFSVADATDEFQRLLIKLNDDGTQVIQERFSSFKSRFTVPLDKHTIRIDDFTFSFCVIWESPGRYFFSDSYQVGFKFLGRSKQKNFIVSDKIRKDRKDFKFQNQYSIVEDKDIPETCFFYDSPTENLEQIKEWYLISQLKYGDNLFTNRLMKISK